MIALAGPAGDALILPLMILNRNVSRLEAFSDAIFGFAATLLVVSLEPPGSYGELVANVRGFAAFALSFAILVLLWAVHNAYFRRYEIEDAPTIVLNAAFLFVVVFYVYPLRYAMAAGIGYLFGRTFGLPSEVLTGDQLANMFVMYGIGWTAAFACIALMYLHARRQRDILGLDDHGAFDAATHARHYGIFVLVGLLSIAVALTKVGVFFGVPGAVFFLLGPLCWWNGVTRTRQRERLAAVRLPPDVLHPGAERASVATER